MLIKAADDRTPTLRELEGILARPDVDAGTRSRIEREIRAVRAGAARERDAAHQIDFWFGQSPNYAVVAALHEILRCALPTGLRLAYGLSA